MKHYAFEVIASDFPDHYPVGKILINETHKDDLWRKTDGTRMRTWRFWNPDTNVWSRVTGKVLVRVCSECRGHEPVKIALHGHDGAHGESAPQWTPGHAAGVLVTAPLGGERLEEIRARRAAISEAPWVVKDDSTFEVGVAAGSARPDPDTGRWPGHWLSTDLIYETDLDGDDPGDAQRKADAEFIAHAPDDVDALLAEVERLTAELAARRSVTPEQRKAAMLALRDYAVEVEEYTDGAHPPQPNTDGCLRRVLAALGLDVEAGESR